jgi:hypothetical protein
MLMARPTKLTRARHERIIELLEEGVPFATACRMVGVSPSAGYDWLYRGWGMHPDRPPAARYVAFARAVDAVFPGGFAERHEDEDEFASASVAERSKDGQAASFADAQDSERTETGFSEAPSVSAVPAVASGFVEGFSDTPRDRARAREEDSGKEPRRAPMPWLSQRSRGRGSIAGDVVDRDF